MALRESNRETIRMLHEVGAETVQELKYKMNRVGRRIREVLAAKSQEGSPSAPTAGKAEPGALPVTARRGKPATEPSRASAAPKPNGRNGSSLRGATQ